MMGKRLISIVIPTHNEYENVRPLYERVLGVFPETSGYDFELIFCDDSADDTAELIKEIHSTDPRVKLIRLTRKFGQAIAITAGLKAAKGAAVVMMDADLQDPPEIIPEMISKWEEGAKVVYIERASQSSSAVYKILSGIFYRLLKGIASIPIPLDAGEFRLLDRSAVDFMNSLKEHSRFMRGLTVWPGFRSAKITIARSERLYGRTNYDFKRSLGVAVDGFVSFSVIPLRAAALVGFVFSVASVAGIIGYLACWLFDIVRFGPGWLSLFLLILFMGGLNLMCLGIIGEYTGRCFIELQGRPLYIVDYAVGFDDDK